MKTIEAIQLKHDRLVLLDQTLLPEKEVWIELSDYRQMIEAIKMLRIRGAPALGLAAVGAAYLASRQFDRDEDFLPKMEKALREIELSRPTAVNLFKATQRIRPLLFGDAKMVRQQLWDLYQNLHLYEEQACLRMAENGAQFIGSDKKLNILTHCNTGSLATVGIGTALGVIRLLAETNDVHVFADETRPLLQGARLTMWELKRDGIPATLITDNMAASIIQRKHIDLIITGADRITANGDTANKIGTLNLAILASYFGIPFYIAAPETTIDASLASGEEIKIEERAPEEVHEINHTRLAPRGCHVCNPAFDVTPSSLITAIFTDKKVYQAPYSFIM